MMRLVLWLLWVLCMTGCASESPAPPPTLPPSVVQLQINASNDVNPGNNGEATPVMLRIFELHDSNSFNTADFFALFNNDKAMLAEDLIHKSELFLKPGEVKNLTLQPSEDVQALGLLAAFRKLDNAQWRTSVKIAPHQTQMIVIRLERNQLKLDVSQP